MANIGLFLLVFAKEARPATNAIIATATPNKAKLLLGPGANQPVARPIIPATSIKSTPKKGKDRSKIMPACVANHRQSSNCVAEAIAARIDETGTYSGHSNLLAKISVTGFARKWHFLLCIACK